MKTSTIVNEKNINRTLIVFCILLGVMVFASSRFYHDFQQKQAQIQIEDISK